MTDSRGCVRSPCRSRRDYYSRAGRLTSHQRRITSTKASRKPRSQVSGGLGRARDRSQIPGRAERARIVLLISVCNHTY